jgi:hypothetical protein
MSFPTVTYRIAVLPTMKFYEFQSDQALTRMTFAELNALKGKGVKLTKDLWTGMRHQVVQAVTHDTCQLSLDPAYILNWNSTKAKTKKKKGKEKEVSYPFYEKSDFGTGTRRAINWENVQRRVTALQTSEDPKYADGQHVALFAKEKYKSSKNVNPSVYKVRNVLGTASVGDVCKSILLGAHTEKGKLNSLYIDVVCSSDKNGKNLLAVAEILFVPCVVELSSILSAVSVYLMRGYTFGSCAMKEDRDTQLKLAQLTHYLAPIFLEYGPKWPKHYASLTEHQKYAVRLLFQYNVCMEQTFHWKKNVYTGEYRSKGVEMCPYYITEEKGDIITDAEAAAMYDCSDQGFYMSRCLHPVKLPADSLEFNPKKRKGYETWTYF